MIDRPYWLAKISRAWKTRPIVWLSGVRRVGKTSLARQLPKALLVDCELPSSQRRLEDPESFYRSQPRGRTIVLDEIHRLRDPSGTMKIAADAFPSLRVLATGSSTLAATRKFRDSLAGRKWTVTLSPVLWTECRDGFHVPDLDKRLLHGGLPEALLSEKRDETFYAEWIDSFYARDVAELFGVRNRAGFLQLLRLLLMQSGGLVDYSKLASESELSRHTVKAHIEAMAIAHAIFSLRPFHGGGTREVVHRPKIYAFDTGFVAFARGWESIRDGDRGVLWEHLVLDALRAARMENRLAFWRDKSGREIDFVVNRGARKVDAIECKIHPGRFNPEILRHFRSIYPHGENFIVTPDEETSHKQRIDGLTVTFTGIHRIISAGERQ